MIRCSYVEESTMSILKWKTFYTFDPKSNSWSIPKINGDAPPVLASASTTVIDQKGKMYLWAGIGSNVPILDTINLVWTKGSSVGAPNVGLLASATTLLPDNKIIYLEDTNNDNISQIYIYDTVNDNWTTKATSGTIPPKKSGMSVILGLDGQRVIIFGGLDFTSKEQLYELSLINFVWRIPKTSGIAPKESRNAHRANVIGNYMVISYGSGYTTENDILLLDISNVNEYIWTNEFKPSSSISISVKTTSVPILPPSTLPPLPPSSQLGMATVGHGRSSVGHGRSRTLDRPTDRLTDRLTDHFFYIFAAFLLRQLKKRAKTFFF
ncbi:hypothetical protein RirG_118990 [Rhizophagus irregularis DAOM 197198w]|uniref:Galactose oxidase n=1 Tax=Rhizophagus irregularis (strain DAOM 197198w) TaxID=1432141 RepID=A0A015JBP1_RHIIW|nr:hypothetical protein RirG_118990 [Rhizophagus irregularis DAOM 197198w]